MRFYKIGEAAKIIGCTRQSLINWSNSGKFKEHHRTPGGHRFYSEEQLKEFICENKEEK